jgi:hypothetical protein
VLPARSVAVILVSALAVLPVTPAVADDPGLAAGRRQVEEGDFETAIATLEPVVARLAPAAGADAAQAALYLGIAHLALDQREPARLRFRQALDFDPKLTLKPDRFSPKVIGAFEEARREREAARAASAPKPGSQAPDPRKGRSSRTLLIAGAGIAAGLGVALAVGGGTSSNNPGALRFAGARFVPQALECPDGAVNQPLPVGIDLDATNDGDSPVTITSVSSVLSIVNSPAVPGEVGFSGSAETSISPTSAPRGMTTLHARTILLCNNGPGGTPRFNEWRGRITVATAAGATALETADTLRVNIP